MPHCEVGSNSVDLASGVLILRVPYIRERLHICMSMCLRKFSVCVYANRIIYVYIYIYIKKTLQ